MGIREDIERRQSELAAQAQADADQIAQNEAQKQQAIRLQEQAADRVIRDRVLRFVRIDPILIKRIQDLQIEKVLKELSGVQKDFKWDVSMAATYIADVKRRVVVNFWGDYAGELPKDYDTKMYDADNFDNPRPKLPWGHSVKERTLPIQVKNRICSGESLDQILAWTRGQVDLPHTKVSEYFDPIDGEKLLKPTFTYTAGWGFHTEQYYDNPIFSYASLSVSVSEDNISVSNSRTTTDFPLNSTDLSMRSALVNAYVNPIRIVESRGRR